MGIGRFFVVWMFVLPLFFGLHAHAEAPIHFYNDSKNIHPDPNYTPGEYALPDINDARTYYQSEKERFLEGVDLGDAMTAFTVGAGELTFSSIKNEKAKVFGYFRNYFGKIVCSENGLKNISLLIDINSLDTAVPGRNNRILDIFFRSMTPELGTARLDLTQFDFSGKNMGAVADHEQVPFVASGSLRLNGQMKDLSVSLVLTKQGHVWLLESAGPIALNISDYVFGDRVYELMHECNHASIGNLVDIQAKLYFR